jgi:hypothetical protein
MMNRGLGAPGLATLLTCSLVLGACDSGAEAAGGNEAEFGAPAWSLSPARAMIGAPDGSEALHRVFGAVLLSDGRVAIGNSGTSEVRFFDPEGRHAFSSGREGAGPGEFRSINWIRSLPGDSLLVWDMRGGRFTVLGPDGRFGRTFRPAVLGGVHPVGLLPDGSIVVVSATGVDPRTQTGRVRDVLAVFTIDRSGARVDSVGAYPGTEWLLYDHAASYRAVQVPLGRKGHVTVVGEHVAYASSESAEVQLFDRSGTLVSAFTLALPARPVQARERDALLEAEIADRAERAVVARHLGASGEVPAPLVTDLRSGADGNLWFRTHPPVGSDTVRWVVASRTGEILGSVPLPAHALPLDIHDGLLVLRETDADGVQRVSVREVLR